MNGEPRGLTKFVNQTEMVSLSSMSRTIGWLTTVLAFVTVACILMLREKELGFQLAVAVLSGLGLASGIGAYNIKTVRESAKEYKEVLEAKERGRTQGAAVITGKVEKVEVKQTNGGNPSTEPDIYRDDERGE